VAKRERAVALLSEALSVAKTLGMRDFEHRIEVLAKAHAIGLEEE